MSIEEKQESLDNAKTKVSRTGTEEDENKYSGFTLLKKPETMMGDVEEFSETGGRSVVKEQEAEEDSRLAT